MPPKFSIITATYNRAYILWRAIQSVLAQTYPYFELLIIDDASTDDTAKLMQIFHDPRIKYHKLKKNQGASHARNFGLRKSKGKYIAYLDSDNAWYPDFLYTMHDGFTRNPDKLLLFCKKNYRLSLIGEKGEAKNIRDEYTNHQKYFDLKRLWHRRILIDTNSMCHKRDEIMEMGGWDEKLNFWEDWELTLRLATKYSEESFMYINRTLLDYEQKIDLEKAEEVFGFWEAEEAKIFQKYKDRKELKNQDWFPPKENNKSTLGVIEYLRNKKSA